MADDFVTLAISRLDLADIVTALEELAWHEGLSGEGSNAVRLAELARNLTEQESWQS